MQQALSFFSQNLSEFLIYTEKPSSIAHQNSILASFSTSFLAILVCETGDKTFFLAMIMAMKYKRSIVFLGAFGALAVMTVLSAVFGKIIFSMIPKIYTDVIVTVLFFYFGFKLLYEAHQIQEHEGSQNSQLKEVQEQLKEMEQNIIRKSKQQNPQIELNQGLSPKSNKKFIFSDKIILSQAFIMTFLAEWGDRSQIATIALAATYNLLFVNLGCLLGHLICTGAAVQLGQWISNKVTEKKVLYAGGFVFILSGIITLWMIFQDDESVKSY